jgi:glycosyltransferase involved in cell wall biosynthesis
MKVSIIITTYNRPEFLKRVIHGYFHQTILPQEIVIADDGSTEETAVMVKKMQKKATVQVFHICHEDQGFRAAQIRNKAVSHSQGEYLILCDDDTIPSPTLVEDHLKYSEEGFFIQGHRVLLGPKVSKYFCFRDISLLNLLKLSIKGQVSNVSNAIRLPIPFIRVSQKLGGIRSCNMSFFKKDFIAVNGFNEDFEGWGKEDSELVVRFYKYGLKRKDVKFRACCYHLYHQPFSRENLEKNIALLDYAQRNGGYFCKNGLVKYLL